MSSPLYGFNRARLEVHSFTCTEDESGTATAPAILAGACFVRGCCNSCRMRHVTVPMRLRLKWSITADAAALQNGKTFTQKICRKDDRQLVEQSSFGALYNCNVRSLASISALGKNENVKCSTEFQCWWMCFVDA